MNTKLGLLALLGLAGALVACGGDDATIDTTPATTTPVETTALPTADQLDALLLGIGDVGSAWRLGPAITDADLTDAIQIPCPDTAINPTIGDRLTPITGVQFEPVDQSSRHLIEFALTGRPERLGADLQALFDTLDACAATTPTTIDTGSLTVERLAIPDLGEQRAAYTLTGVQGPEATWYVRTAYARVGSIAVEIGLTEILPAPDDQPSVSDDEFVQLVQTAVAGLQATSELANPASVYCVDQGGRVDIVDEAGGQVGYCELPDGRRVEEWEYYRSSTATTEP
jgi:putative hemolysin